MILRCLASGSNGNCYLLQRENETLILDCGIDIKKIKKGLNWNVSNIAGVLCTHVHKDHSLSVKDFENMGIPVFKLYDKTKACPLKIRYGSFDIQAFKLPHNGTPNYGYFIKALGHKILYLTDFEYCPYVFKKQEVNHILVECNYQQELVDRDLPQYEHKIKGHCSLETCKNFIIANKTNALRNVILCHLGAETTIAEECVAEVQKVSGTANVRVAEAGKTWELNLYPF